MEPCPPLLLWELVAHLLTEDFLQPPLQDWQVEQQQSPRRQQPPPQRQSPQRQPQRQSPQRQPQRQPAQPIEVETPQEEGYVGDMKQGIFSAMAQQRVEQRPDHPDGAPPPAKFEVPASLSPKRQSRPAQQVNTTTC